MNPQPDIYRFIIEGCTPDDLSMARLAKYLAALARLFGNVHQVHFERLEEGSAVIVQRVDSAACPAVKRRLHSAGTLEASDEITESCRALNRCLAQDNASGRLLDIHGDQLAHFPGHNQPVPQTLAPIWQKDSLDGTLTSIGGSGATASVHLQDGTKKYVAKTTPQVAKKIACHLYNGTLRVYGDAQWERTEGGVWKLKRFNVESFELLDDVPLDTAVRELREIEGSGWKQIKHPVTELHRLRRDGDDDDC